MPSRPPSLKAKKPKARPATRWQHKLTRQQRGYGVEHQRLRERVMIEEPLCRKCAEANAVSATAQIDHIVPLSQGGQTVRSNMQGLCLPCHRAKTSREAAAARRRAR